MSDDARPLAPAFYAAPATTRRAVADWWVLLHPPYTLWHLSYVAIGAAVAPRFDGGRLGATVLAFALAVGVSAHALDELQGRPLRTAISSRVLVGVACLGLAGSVTLGIIGVSRVGLGLGAFIVAGVVLNCGYNLELIGGRLHNDVTFAFAWGAFPVLTAYYAQAETLRVPALVAAAAAYWLASAQRALSTPARALRRRVASVDGTMECSDGRTAIMSIPVLLSPLERALRAMTWGVVALAVALVTFRLTDI